MPMRVGFIQYRRQMLERQLEETMGVFPTLGIEKAILIGDAVTEDVSPSSTLDFVFVHNTDRPFGRRADFFSYHLDAAGGHDLPSVHSGRVRTAARYTAGPVFGLQARTVVFDA